MLRFRSLVFSLGYYLSSALAGLIAVIIWPIFPYSWRWRIVTCWNRFAIAWLRLCCNIRLEIIGSKHVDNFPCVVMAKHQSTWETLFLQYYFGPVSTILKRELFRIPFFGWGLASLRPIAIDRSNPMQALKEIKRIGMERLHQGNNLLIFPEGTRTPVGQAGNYARSGADIAISAGVPVIAVAHNAGECWPHKHFIKYPGTIRVVISEPFTTEQRDRRELTEAVRNWIEGEIANMPPARLDGVRAAQVTGKQSG